MDEFVHWLGRVQQLRRDFAAANWKRSVKKADLDKH
jgi:hypothetical protein